MGGEVWVPLLLFPLALAAWVAWRDRAAGWPQKDNER